MCRERGTSRPKRHRQTVLWIAQRRKRVGGDKKFPEGVAMACANQPNDVAVREQETIRTPKAEPAVFSQHESPRPFIPSLLSNSGNFLSDFSSLAQKRCAMAPVRRCSRPKAGVTGLTIIFISVLSVCSYPGMNTTILVPFLCDFRKL